MLKTKTSVCCFVPSLSWQIPDRRGEERRGEERRGEDRTEQNRTEQNRTRHSVLRKMETAIFELLRMTGRKKKSIASLRMIAAGKLIKNVLCFPQDG